MSKDIKRYLFCTFLLSWVLWGVLVCLTRLQITRYGSPLAMIIFVFAGIMPALCEIGLKKKYSSKADFSSFINNIVNPKHSIGWYLLIIALAFVSCYLPTLFGGAAMQHPLYTALLQFPVMIVGGGLEEIGWRGFLQPTFQKRLSAFFSTLIISGIWAAWHIPEWFIPGTSNSNINFIYFAITIMALSFLLAAIYNATSSVFLCLVFHALINAFWTVYVPNDQILPAVPTLIFAVSTFYVLKLFKRKEQIQQTA